MSALYVFGHQAMVILQDQRVFFGAMGERIAALQRHIDRISALPKTQQKLVMQVLDSVISSSGTMTTQR